MLRAKNNFWSAFFLLLWTSACHAERADRDKPLRLESDQVVINDATKISTFTGNVRLTQGTLLINGDKIVVTQDKDGFKHGTIYGKAASFRQKRDGADEYLEGQSERIEYDARAEVIEFNVQARVKRGLDEVRGERITYHIKTEIFQADSGVDSGSASAVDKAPKRVSAVLQPQPKPGTTLPNAATIKPGDTPTPAP